MSQMLYAGVSRRVINPHIGIEKIGLRLFGEAVQAIQSDLTVTVLVLASETNRVTLIACDLCNYHNQVPDEIR